jgi:hypothetical protein
MQTVTPEFRRGMSGGPLVLGLLGLAAGLAAFAVWFQWNQTRRCLEFFGPAAARRIQEAPRVEMWGQLRVRPDGRGLEANQRVDLTSARGLVHLRRGLVEDANYAWTERSGSSAVDRWDVALVFFDRGSVSPAAVLAFDLDESDPAVTVVGQPGRVKLGRIAGGLRRWLASAVGAGPGGPDNR